MLLRQQLTSLRAFPSLLQGPAGRLQAFAGEVSIFSSVAFQRLQHPVAQAYSSPVERADLGIESFSYEQRLWEVITPALGSVLQQQGYAVIDGVFGAHWADRLRQEVQQLHQDGRMHLNCTHLVRGGSVQLLEKSQIYEADLLVQETRGAAELFLELEADSTLRMLLSLYLPQLRLDSQAIKLQHNAGNGGCFPLHFDSDEELDGRRVSAVVYLNPGWRPGDGGELRLYPFPDDPVSIPPLHDRMVLFASTRMLHRVLPSRKERYCFTVWMSETRRRPPLAVNLKQLLKIATGSGSIEAMQKLLLKPEVFKHICKVAYAEEWAESIKESHPDSSGRDAAVERFWEEVGIIKAALQPLLPSLEHLNISKARMQWF